MNLLRMLKIKNVIYITVIRVDAQIIEFKWLSFKNLVNSKPILIILKQNADFAFGK
jgi:hypothetical protein